LIVDASPPEKNEKKFPRGYALAGSSASIARPPSTSTHQETAMSEQRYSLGRNEAVNPLTVKPQFSTKPVGAARCAAVRTPQRLAPYLSVSLRPGFRILR